jgi:hypothetical protein
MANPVWLHTKGANGRVHSHNTHLYALLETAKDIGGHHILHSHEHGGRFHIPPYQQHHPAPPGLGSSVIEAINYFDQEALSYDDQPFVVEIARQLAKSMLETCQFSDHKTAVMDYACGTGTINRGYLRTHCSFQQVSYLAN